MRLLTLPIRSRHTPRTLFSHSRNQQPQVSSTIRSISTTPVHYSVLGLDRRTHYSKLLEQSRGLTRAELAAHRDASKRDPNRIKIYPCTAPSARAVCKDPTAAVTQAQLTVLDPNGARTKLFDRHNIEGARVGDILLVRTAGGDPVSGVCLNIRRRGVDTSILLRNNVTRVGVEMWFKVYSPNVEGIEVVQRRAKRARRARLYYMRYVQGPIVLLLIHAYSFAECRSTILGRCKALSSSTFGRDRRCLVERPKAGMGARASARERSTGDTVCEVPDCTTALAA